MAKLKVSPPWVTFYHEIEALFGRDPDIGIIYDEDENIINLYVDNPSKADAMTQLLPPERTFGNVTIRVNIIPGNTVEATPESLFEAAFANNPVLAFTKSVPGVFSNPIAYVVFQNKVVQFWNDNLNDVYGNCTTLYQDIAKDVFGEHDGIFYCTDREKKVG